VLRSNKSRKKWDIGGPYSIGAPVYAMAFDQRQGRRRLWWAQQSFQWGTVLCSSDDYGKDRDGANHLFVNFLWNPT